jgi:DNA polymerase elongation subunit (family B)
MMRTARLVNDGQRAYAAPEQPLVDAARVNWYLLRALVASARPRGGALPRRGVVVVVGGDSSSGVAEAMAAAEEQQHARVLDASEGEGDNDDAAWKKLARSLLATASAGGEPAAAAVAYDAATGDVLRTVAAAPSAAEAGWLEALTADATSRDPQAPAVFDRDRCTFACVHCGRAVKHVKSTILKRDRAVRASQWKHVDRSDENACTATTTATAGVATADADAAATAATAAAATTATWERDRRAHVERLEREHAARQAALASAREARARALEAPEPPLVFQAVDWAPLDVPRRDFDGADELDEEEGGQATAHFCVDVYGVDDRHRQHVLRVVGFRPYFYVRVPLTPGNLHLDADATIDCLLDEDTLHARYHADIARAECRYEMRSEFNGFQFDRKARFLRLAFFNDGTRRRLRRALRRGVALPAKYFGGDGTITFDTFDGSMPPLLQCFHAHELDPSGWVRVAAAHFAPHPDARHLRSDRGCASQAAAAHVTSTSDEARGIGPLLLCSYDIECDSSHGDFPLARKTYAGLANELVAYCGQTLKESKMVSQTKLEDLLRSVFDGPRGGRVANNRIATVHAKRGARPSDEACSHVAREARRAIFRASTAEYHEGDQVRYKLGGVPRQSAVTQVVEPTTAAAANDADGKPPAWYMKLEGRARKRAYTSAEAAKADRQGLHVERIGGVRRFDEMNAPEWRRRRDAVAKALARTMDEWLPPIEGDRVIQVGTVFWRYGEDHPCERHVVALDTCEAVEGATVVPVQREAAVLTEWAALIRARRPNVLVGYNTFGFDNKFMWERADELGCLHAFGDLSLCGPRYATRGEHVPHRSHASLPGRRCRAKDQAKGFRGYTVCRCEGGRSKLLRKDLNSAGMGDNTLYFMDLPGVVQVDCMKTVMRDYKLDSYKLDAVSGEFLSGDAERVEVGAEAGTEAGTEAKAQAKAQAETEAQAQAQSAEAQAEAADGRVLEFTTSDAYGIKLDDYVQLFAKSIAGTDAVGAKLRVRALLDRDRRPVAVGRGPTTVRLAPTPEAAAVFDAWPPGVAYRWGLVKDDVTPAQIFEYQRGTAAQRALVAKYCLNDCELVLLLLNKLKIVSNNVAMASIACVPLPFLFLRGQSVKGHSLVGRTCHRDRVSIRDKADAVNEENDDETLDDDEIERTIESYEGAIVIKPEPRIHDRDPIVVLDFASLYPSSQIADNLSPETQVLDPAYLGEAGGRRLRAEGFEFRDVVYDNILCTRRGKTVKRTKDPSRPEVRCRFVQPMTGADGVERRRGIIPKICQQLLRERKRVKQQMKSAADPFTYMLLDGQQLALKVSVNSIYGLLGGVTSPIHCKDVAASTTAHGRAMLLQAKDFVESTFVDKPFAFGGRAHTVRSARVVYGDTDSIFVRFDVRDATSGERVEGKAALPVAIALGEEASRGFNAVAAPPHNLEYEKTFYPWITFSPKRYAGMKYEFDPTKCKLSYMGIALKRRDNARIVKDIYAAVLDDVLSGRGLGAARQTLRAHVGRLMRGEVPIEKLVITKALRAYYANPEQQVHVNLAMRVAERNKGEGYRPNDRVPYVYRDLGGRAVQLQGERVEDPAYMVANGLRPDYLFYLTNQIEKPLMQIFALAVEQLPGYKYDGEYFDRQRESALRKNPAWDDERLEAKISELRVECAGQLLFDDFKRAVEREREGSRSLDEWVPRARAAVKQSTATTAKPATAMSKKTAAAAAAASEAKSGRERRRQPGPGRQETRVLTEWFKPKGKGQRAPAPR